MKLTEIFTCINSKIPVLKHRMSKHLGGCQEMRENVDYYVKKFRCCDHERYKSVQ